MTKSLYHYTDEFLQIKAALEEADLDEEVYKDTLESYEEVLGIKMENMIKYRNELIGLAGLQKMEAKKLENAAKAKEVQAERLKEHMDQTMRAMEVTELQAGAYKLNYRMGSEVVVIDEKRLPEEYFTTEVTKKPFSKPDLKKLLKEGKEIEGVCLKRNRDTLQIKM